MTFQQLTYLLEVSRTGSVSGAAKNLFLAQSSVSAAISNLEKELGFDVFIRSKKGVIPTVQGEEVLEQAARICESYRSMTDPERSRKRLLSVSAPAMELLDEAFADLVKEYAHSPLLSLSLEHCSTMETAEKLCSFELSGAVLLNHEARILSVETLLHSKELAVRKLALLPVLVQLGPSHPLYEKEEIEAAALAEHLFVDDTRESLLHNEYLKGILQLTPERTVSVSNSHVAQLLVGRGQCYSIGAGAPKRVCDYYGLRSIPLKNVRYVLSAVTNPRRQTEKEILRYFELIGEKLKQYGIEQ